MIRRQYFNIAVLVIAVFLLALILNDSYNLIRDRDANKQIAMLGQYDYLDDVQWDLAEIDVLLAYAAMQTRFQLYDEAIESYSRAERMASQQQLPAIYYNLGNIHLKQSIAAGENTEVDKAVAMADVAKEYYRFALQADPQFWDAKYNYESAQRLSRDLPLGDLVENESTQDSSAELWSAMPGFPVGLP